MTKTHLLVLLKVAISGGLIWFLVSTINLGDAKARLMSADIGLLLSAALVLLFQMVIGGARWWAVVRAINAPFPYLELVRLFYIGNFFAQALPSSVGGDPIRMYMTYKGGMPLSKAVNGVMLERVVTVAALVILVIAIQPVFLDKLSPAQSNITLAALALLTLGTCMGIALLMSLDRLPDGLRRFRVIRGMGSLAQDTRSVFLQPTEALISMVFGVLTHVNIASCVYLIALSLDISVTWVDCLVLMPPVLLVTTIPISIAGWGVRESAMVTAFALVGVSADAALVLSIVLGFMAIIIMLPAGLIWLIGRSRGEAVSASEAAELFDDEMLKADGSRSDHNQTP